MVGFRIFDVGLLVLWLVWFFRLRDDGDDASDEDDGGGGLDPEPRPTSGPDRPGRRIGHGERRLRDHGRPRSLPGVRRPTPAPRPIPARVRRPAVPLPATRRSARDV